MKKRHIIYILSIVLFCILAVIFIPIVKRNIADGYVKQGNELKTNGNYDQAIIFYKKALSLISDYSDAKKGIIGIYILQGDIRRNNKNYDEAIKFYQKGLDIDQNSGEIRNNIAKTYIQQGMEYRDIGNLGEAINFFKKAIEIVYYHLYSTELFDTALKCIVDIIIDQGNEKQNNGLYYDAIVHFQEAIIYLESIKKPSNHGFITFVPIVENSMLDIYYLQGNNYLLNNNFDEAIQSFQKALSLNYFVVFSPGLEKEKNRKLIRIWQLPIYGKAKNIL